MSEQTKRLSVVGFYLGILCFSLTKTCNTNDVCALLCINMVVTYLLKKG